MISPLIWTSAGLAALVNASQTGAAPLTIGSVGLSAHQVAGDLAALKALTALPNELRRIEALGGEVVDPALIHLTATDDSAHVYEARTIGVYATTGLLLALYSQAESILVKSAESVLLFALDLPLVDAISPETVQIGGAGFSVPPATHTRRGVVELATPAEAAAGSDDERAVTPAGLHAATATRAWRTLFLALGAA